MTPSGPGELELLVVPRALLIVAILSAVVSWYGVRLGGELSVEEGVRLGLG